MRINLPGTNPTEVLLFSILLLAIVALLTFLWESSVIIFLWLLGLTIWFFLHTKKNAQTHYRFSELDQRDMDFKDECDVQFEKLKKLEEKVGKLSE